LRVISKYRLELHWDAVEYPTEDVAVLNKAYFVGPVLKEAAKINPNDQLMLDMTYQHAIFIPEYYQALLQWKGVDYRDDQIFLKGATLKGKHVNSVEPLKATDFILIDCREHEEEKHAFHLVYWAEVCKADKEKKF